MKRLVILIVMMFMFTCFSACATDNNADEDVVSEETIVQEEEKDMKLFINDKEIPVTWEDNESVKEIMEEVKNHLIVVDMTMYGGNEQYGYLGREYTNRNTNITTESGDIVLYNNDNIVVFYGSNTWSYTKLGKMNLCQDELEELLGNGNVTLKLAY